MNLRSILIGSFLSTLFLSGCVVSGFPESAEVDGSGDTTTKQTQSVRCGSFGIVDRYLAGGDGDVSIQVIDGAGKTVLESRPDVNGEINDSLNVAGRPGDWKLVVDAEGFAGQFKISLQCP
jgi:hypothetical protein